MIQIPGFRTVLRGYDPTEVDRAIGDLIKARDQARSEAADNAIARTKAQTELSQLEEQAAGYRARLGKLEAAAAESPSSSEVGARIGRMLALAEDEADEIRTQASAEAERVLAAAKAEVDQVTGNAERHARDVVSKADTEAARILEAARRQSDEIVDYADREAVSRREEAEAIYQAHRGRAAAAADEFERGLAERQQQADADFASRTQLTEQAIATLLSRQESLQAEAEQAAEQARTEAEVVVRAAQEEARQQLDAARGEAARLRAESESELRAARVRRDAINAQLGTVRRMLDDLDAEAAPDGPGPAPESDHGQRAGGPPAREVDSDPADRPSATETRAEADAEAENVGMARSGQR